MLIFDYSESSAICFWIECSSDLCFHVVSDWKYFCWTLNHADVSFFNFFKFDEFSFTMEWLSTHFEMKETYMDIGLDQQEDDTRRFSCQLKSLVKCHSQLNLKFLEQVAFVGILDYFDSPFQSKQFLAIHLKFWSIRNPEAWAWKATYFRRH